MSQLISRRMALQILGTIAGGLMTGGCSGIKSRGSLPLPNLLYLKSNDPHFRSLAAEKNPENHSPNPGYPALEESPPHGLND